MSSIIIVKVGHWYMCLSSWPRKIVIWSLIFGKITILDTYVFGRLHHMLGKIRAENPSQLTLIIKQASVISTAYFFTVKKPV